MNNWISVKDRLPEIPDGIAKSEGLITPYILITLVLGEEKISCPGVYRYTTGEWMAFSNYGRLKEITDEYTVTHWMPMPEPPKGE